MPIRCETPASRTQDARGAVPSARVYRAELEMLSRMPSAVSSSVSDEPP